MLTVVTSEQTINAVGLHSIRARQWKLIHTEIERLGNVVTTF